MMLSVMMSTDLIKISGSSTLHQLLRESTAGDQILFNLLEYKEENTNTPPDLLVYCTITVTLSNLAMYP